MPEQVGVKNAQDCVSRLETLRVHTRNPEYEPEMPDPGAGAYLLHHFSAVGPTLGDQPVSQSELRAYQDNFGIELTPWECQTLRRLSIDKLNESHRATKPDSKAPWKPEELAYVARLAAAIRMEREMDAVTNL